MLYYHSFIRPRVCFLPLFALDVAAVGDTSVFRLFSLVKPNPRLNPQSVRNRLQHPAPLPDSIFSPMHFFMSASYDS